MGRTEEDIIKKWKRKAPPLISITCITFNHANYIRDALDGFLMQKTNFAFEILLHDDASTDGTEEIIREYEVRYPTILKPLYEKENQYSQGRRGSRTFNFPRAKGKYIALCEGDDYWIDPYKLQKQVDFMEANSEYGLVYTDFKVFNQTTETFKSSPTKMKYNGYVFYKLLYKNFVPTLTVCFRTELLFKINMQDILEQDFLMGDIPLWIEMSRKAKFHYLDDISSVYRVLPNSVMHGSLKKELANRFELIKIRRYFLKKYSKEYKINIFNRGYLIIVHQLNVLKFLFVKIIRLVQN